MTAAKQQVTRCEKAIEDNEAQCRRVQTEMEEAQSKGRYEAIAVLCAQLEELQKQSDALYEALEEAELQVSALDE